MPDITMCNGMPQGKFCPLKDDCYRHMAHTSAMQSMFADPPGRLVKNGDDEHFECAFFTRIDTLRALHKAVGRTL